MNYRACHWWGLDQPPLASKAVECLTPKIEGRALAVQISLAERGVHRAASIPDLLIAATAELAHLTVLHVDKDFDLVAQVTGQPMERLRLWPHHCETERCSLQRSAAGEQPGTASKASTPMEPRTWFRCDFRVGLIFR